MSSNDHETTERKAQKNERKTKSLKEKSVVIKNFHEDVSEEVTKIHDLKLIKSILTQMKEAKVDDSIVTKAESHLTRTAGKPEYNRPLKIFTKSREHRDFVKFTTVRLKRKFHP